MSERVAYKTVTAWARLFRAQRHLLEAVESALKAADLPPLAWYDVLLELYQAGEDGLRQYQIAERILLSKHNLSRLLDRLEAEGLAVRRACPEDARGKVSRITPAGTDLLRRMWPVYARVMRERFEARLSSEEIAALAAIMAKLQAEPA